MQPVMRHEETNELGGVASMLNDDELRGKADQIKGRVKDAVGRATGDEQLRDEGAVDEASGKVQEGVGKGRRKIGEAIEDLGNSVKR